MFCFFQIYSKQEQFLNEQSKWMLPAISLWSFSKIETVNTLIALFDFLKNPTLTKKYTHKYIYMVISKTKNTSKTVFISLNENQRKRILALLIKSIVNVCLSSARHSPKPCSRANDQRAQLLIEGDSLVIVVLSSYYSNIA